MVGMGAPSPLAFGCSDLAAQRPETVSLEHIGLGLKDCEFRAWGLCLGQRGTIVMIRWGVVKTMLHLGVPGTSMWGHNLGDHIKAM